MKTELIEKLKVIENFFTRTNDKESKEAINEAIALLEKPMHDYAGQSDAELKEHAYNEAFEDVRQIIEPLQQSEWVSVEKYDKSRFTPPFRVGRKKKRAILDSKGLEVIIFPNSEPQAQMYCDWLNLTPPNR
jgi:hypothetical protein